MRVLIMGSRSFVGRRVAERLRGAHTVETAERDAGADLHLELGGPAALPAPRECAYDAIVHCAASFEPSTPAGMLRNELVNAVGAIVRAENKPDLRGLRFPAGDDIFTRIGRPPLIDLPRGLALMRDQRG